MKIKDNYIYNVNINQWVVLKFLERRDIKDFKSLKVEHIYLLFAIVYLYNQKNLKSKVINDSRFVFISDSLLIGNLPFIGCGSRQLKSRLKVLLYYGFIKRHIEDERIRYLSVDNLLLHLAGYGALEVSPVTRVEKWITKEYKEIYNKYKGQFTGRKKITDYIASFDNTEHSYWYMDKNYRPSLDDVLRRLELYLIECVKDPYYNNK